MLWVACGIPVEFSGFLVLIGGVLVYSVLSGFAVLRVSCVLGFLT